MQTLKPFLHCVQIIRRVIDKQTVELYAMFTNEINQVKREFSHQAPNVPISQPRFASQAIWARLLKRRIDIPMKVTAILSIENTELFFYTIIHLVDSGGGLLLAREGSW